MLHPYANLVGFRIVSQSPGESRLEITVRDELFNPNGVVHGGVLFAMADTGMGAALHQMLSEGELCATINCSISYFKSVNSGTVSCVSKVINRGRSIATLESEIWNADSLVATAHGQFSVFTSKRN